MNMLIDALPTEINLSGVLAPVRTDFRVWMQIEQLLGDDDLTPKQRAMQALVLCYERPEDLADGFEAFQGVLWFFRCGQPRDKRMEKRAEAVGIKRIYDYDQDAELFYAAFMEQYGIDLCTVNLHWWQFKALFHGLKDDTLLAKVMGYRNTSLSEVDGKARQRVAQMQSIYRLRNGKSEEEKEAAFFDPNTAYFEEMV